MCFVIKNVLVFSMRIRRRRDLQNHLPPFRVQHLAHLVIREQIHALAKTRHVRRFNLLRTSHHAFDFDKPTPRRRAQRLVQARGHFHPVRGFPFEHRTTSLLLVVSNTNCTVFPENKPICSPLTFGFGAEMSMFVVVIVLLSFCAFSGLERREKREKF